MADPDAPSARPRARPLPRLLRLASRRRAQHAPRRARRAMPRAPRRHGRPRARWRDFDCPSYNADVQDSEGFPEGADRLRELIQTTDAFVISSPEYNASMPGVLKNALDWVSRFKPQPFNEKHGLLMSASPSMVGGNRGLWALRMPFEHLGARIYPDMFSLAQSHQAFDGDGRIANDAASGTLRCHPRRLHGPRRGRQALPVRQDRLGRVPRRAPGPRPRSGRVDGGRRLPRPQPHRRLRRPLPRPRDAAAGRRSGSSPTPSPRTSSTGASAPRSRRRGCR